MFKNIRPRGPIIGHGILTNVILATSEDSFNTLRPRWNEQHFSDDIFKRIFFNENVWILIKISLKFVPKGPINNIPALVQIMAWRRTGNKPLCEPMMVRLSTHICVTRPQWVIRALRVFIFMVLYTNGLPMKEIIENSYHWFVKCGNITYYSHGTVQFTETLW